MHALVLASLKTWNPKESARRETVPLASCSTGSSSGREVLSTSCSRWPFRVTCLGERGKKTLAWKTLYAFHGYSCHPITCIWGDAFIARDVYTVAPFLSHPSTTDEVWYWLKCVCTLLCDSIITPRPVF